MKQNLCSPVESKSRYHPPPNPLLPGKPSAAAATLCCAHRIADPPRDVTDLQVVTSVPSLGEKVNLHPGRKQMVRG